MQAFCECEFAQSSIYVPNFLCLHDLRQLRISTCGIADVFQFFSRGCASPGTRPTCRRKRKIFGGFVRDNVLRGTRSGVKTIDKAFGGSISEREGRVGPDACSASGLWQAEPTPPPTPYYSYRRERGERRVLYGKKLWENSSSSRLNRECISFDQGQRP